MTCRVAKKGPLAVMTALVAVIHVEASHRLDGCTRTAMTCRVAKKGPLAVMTALVAVIHVKASHRLDGC